MLLLKIHESFNAKAEADVLKHLIRITKVEGKAMASDLDALVDSTDPEEKQIFYQMALLKNVAGTNFTRKKRQL